MDWSAWENWSEKEFACTHCGKCEVLPELVDMLQEIRSKIGKPMFISSGYRCASHPVEVTKDKPGEHTTGFACDVICHGSRAVSLAKLFLDYGVTRIGFHQKGTPSHRFIHVGLADKHNNRFASAMWTY